MNFIFIPVYAVPRETDYTAAGIQRTDSIDKLIVAILAAGTTEGIDAHTGATFTSTAVLEALNKILAEEPATEEPAAEGAFTPGTYEATAQGFGGEVRVVVSVDGTAITNIEITGNSETPALGGAAILAMAEAYPGKADADAVDGMVGAIVTSSAVKEAVAKALAQAKDGH